MKKILAYTFCTFFGAGFFPALPGTFTSLLAILLVFLLQPGLSLLFTAILIALILGITLTSEIEKNDGTDPGHIVIDELAGQWLTFFFIGHLSILIILAGFILFRLFDILKPLGINKIQELKGGWGVMLDDVLAAIYANTILHLLILTGIIS